MSHFKHAPMRIHPSSTEEDLQALQEAVERVEDDALYALIHKLFIWSLLKQAGEGRLMDALQSAIMALVALKDPLVTAVTTGAQAEARAAQLAAQVNDFTSAVQAALNASPTGTSTTGP